MLTASALLESAPAACLQMAPEGGPVLVMRDLTALDFAGSFPLAAFQIHCPPPPWQPLVTSPLHDISAPTAELMPQSGWLSAKLGGSAYIANKG